MSQVSVSTELPQEIVEGLKSGLYKRVGGAIRDVSTQEIIAWLREAYDLSEPLISDVLSLSAAPANAHALNLALTTMQFAVVMKRLDTIQQELKQLQELLHSIDYKIDLSFYANFRAALDLATNTFTMANAEFRRAAAMQAINRFLEAEHQYTELADVEIANRSQVADDYLYTLCLAYVTEAWCYLELDELDTAVRRLQEGLAVIRPRFERHARTLLTSNPAAYLHPSLKNRIGLKRLADIYRWLTPAVDDATVFENQRENLFRLAQHPEKWIESLPPAIRLPVKSRSFGRKLVSEVAKQIGQHSLAKGLTGFVEAFKPGMTKPADEADDDVFARLPGTLQLLELMIEHCARFETYLAELQTVRDLGMSFHEWQRLAPADTAAPPQAGLLCITFSPRSH